MIIGYDAWKRQDYLLSRMSLGELIRAYFLYPAIQVYIVVILLAAAAALTWMTSPLAILGAFVAAMLVYPLVWYLLHRFVLHARWLYKSPLTAAVWKRIHYDHHQNPENLAVLFGGLHTTLPTILIVTGPIGWAIGGPTAAAASIAGATLATCFYEFCHCIQHLAYRPKTAFLRRIRRLHLAHHFHNENGNYGITNFMWDRLLSSYYAAPGDVPSSPTVHNLGYTETEAARYPWAAALSTEPQTPRRTDDEFARS